MDIWYLSGGLGVGELLGTVRELVRGPHHVRPTDSDGQHLMATWYHEAF